MVRRDTTANWTLANPVLSAGEPALDTTTGLVRYGDGITPWADLPSSSDVIDQAAAAAATVAVEAKFANPTTITALSATYAPASQRTVNGVKPPKVGKVVTTFQPGHGFTNYNGTLASVVDDATVKAMGNQSLTVTTKSDATGGNTQNAALPAFDATGKDLTVTLRVDDVTNLTQLAVYATSDASFASYYLWTVEDNGGDAQQFFKSTEWQSLTLSFADATVVGTPNRAALTVLRLRAQCANGSSTTVHYNRIALVPAATQAVVSICTDDLYASNWSLMRPILDNYGFAATAYAIPERATSQYVSLSQLHQLEDVNGWEVAGHGLTNLTTLSIADAEKDVVATRSWLQGNGFRGVDHFAYPNGGFNPAIEAVMRRLYRSCRTTIFRTVHETLPPANAYRLRARSLSNVTPPATSIAAITAAAANPSWYILVVHDLVASTADDGTEYLAADFDSICASIASQGIAVKTVGDVLAGM